MPRKIRKGWEIFEFFPPVFVRLLAREKVGKAAVRVLTDSEIAIRGGLTVEQVEIISKQGNWDQVTVGLAKRFCEGCNLDFFEWKVRNSAYALAKGGSFAYLKCSPDWHTKLKPLLLKYMKQWADEKNSAQKSLEV